MKACRLLLLSLFSAITFVESATAVEFPSRVLKRSVVEAPAARPLTFWVSVVLSETTNAPAATEPLLATVTFVPNWFVQAGIEGARVMLVIVKSGRTLGVFVGVLLGGGVLVGVFDATRVLVG